MKISFLHTSKTHIHRFDKIIQKISDSINVKHYVHEALLAIAQNNGKADEEAFKNVINEIRNHDNNLIICTCSTYGELCESLENVYRIDQPIGTYIIANYSKIGIACTLNSTKETSKKLLKNIAKANKKSIQIVEINCSNSWPWFEEGNLEMYELEIANQIKKVSNGVEVVLLAQASMEGAKKHFTNENYEVVSSPEFGVKKYLELMRIS